MPPIMKTVWCIILVGFLPPTLSAQQKAYVSPAGTKFLLYTPPSYANSMDEYPLLISLHGKGEWGDDLTKLTSANATGMPSRLIHNNHWPQSYNFIVLTPQYNPPDPNTPNPVWPADHIDEVVNYVFSQWRIMKQRVYVTGLSLGANATWNYAAAYPDKVAAVVPISGRADFTKACFVKDIPAWVFHGDGDVTATPAYSRDMIQAIDNCSPAGSFNRQFNMLYTRNHDGWNEIYNGSSGYRIFDWLLKHARDDKTNHSPYVEAGPDLNVGTEAGNVTITGDAFDSDGRISSISWKQTQGVALALSNANTLTPTVGNLQPGTYEFELTITDDDDASVSDRMILNVYSEASLPRVSELTLIDGATGRDLLTLTDGITINKEQLQTSQFNIRAQASEDTRSVRFSVNTYRNARTVNSPNSYLIKPQSNTLPEWEIGVGRWVICATPFTAAGGGGTRGISRCVSLEVIEGTPAPGCDGAGLVYREVWPGVPGKYVTDIPRSTPPSFQSPLYLLEGPTGETGAGDNYAARIRGYLCPPATGMYQFWIASDEQSELWLSKDDSPAKKVRVAYVNDFTNPREWSKYESQISPPIQLSAGTRYYFEVLHKESALADHVAVGWQLPDGAMERPIPAMRLIPFKATPSPKPPRLTSDAFIIYPNPIRGTGDRLKLRGPEGQSTRFVGALVIGSTGQTVKEIALDCASPCNDAALEFHDLPAGIYTIHVLTEEGRVSKRFVVR
jgi:predicted esterase